MSREDAGRLYRIVKGWLNLNDGKPVPPVPPLP